MKRRTLRYGLSVILALVLWTPGFADDQSKGKSVDKPKNADIDNIGNRNINKGSINLISLEKEIEMGRQMAAEIERQVKLVQDPAVNEYVNRIAQNIARNSDAKVPLTVKVIESEEVNAFALPGGFLFVNTGLIVAADDEAELAGVLAHEIAHVAARNATENASKAQILNIASIPLIFLGGPAGIAVRQAAGMLVPMQFLQFSRKAEADFLGVQYLYKTGYDPGAFLSFFEKLQAKEKLKPGTMSKLFSTHPPTADRVVMTKNNIEQVLTSREQYVVTTSEFGQIKAQIERTENRFGKHDENKPTLKRKTPRPDVGQKDDSQNKRDAPSGTPDNDDRPTLKRRNP